MRLIILLVLALLGSAWVPTIPTSLGQSIEARPSRFLNHPGDLLTVLGTAPPNDEVVVQVSNPTGDLVATGQTTVQPSGSFSVAILRFPDFSSVLFPYGAYIIQVNAAAAGVEMTTAAMFSPPFEIFTDKETYEPTDLVTISGTGPPEDEMVIQVLNPNGILVATGQTSADQDGNYEVQVMRFPPQQSTLFPYGDYTVRATAAAAGATVTTTIAFIGPRPPAIERVPASLPILTNQFGDPISNPRVGQVIGIQSSLRNNDTVDQVFVFIVQVRDADLVVVDLGWIRNVRLEPGQTLDPALSWTPEVTGEYIIDIFVLQSFDEPFPLSKSHQLTISVM